MYKPASQKTINKSHCSKPVSVILLILLNFALFSCSEPPPEEANNQSSLSIAKAKPQWDHYIGLYQKDAVLTASRKEYIPDDQAIHYRRSYSVRHAGDDYLGYVWDWVSQNRHIVFLSGMRNNSGITNGLIINHQQLSIDEIIANFINERKHARFGIEEKDYFINIWQDYHIQSRENLSDNKNYPTIIENQRFDLTTYSDYVDCQSIYWINGSQRGALSNSFKNILSELTTSLHQKDLNRFEQQLPEIMEMECSAFFEKTIYELLVNFEGERIQFETEVAGSRSTFLESFLEKRGTDNFAGRDICQVIANSITQKNWVDRRSSIELARLFVQHSEFENQECSLTKSISLAAKLGQSEFVQQLIEIEKSNPSEKISQQFKDTLLHAVRNAAEGNQSEIIGYLSQFLADTTLSDYDEHFLLEAAIKSDNIEILSEILAIAPFINKASVKIIEQAITRGNIEIISRLLDIGFKIPTDVWTQESLLWSAFQFDKNTPAKNSGSVYQLLKSHGLKINSLTPEYRFTLLEKIYRFGQTAWILTESDDSNLVTHATRYLKDIKALTAEYLSLNRNINQRHGKEQNTLLIIATKGNLPDIIELILTKNPALSIKNKASKTALDIARRESKIYILGIRNDSQKIVKENALRVLELVGGNARLLRPKL